MKKKLIGIGVASLGVILSVGGAIALYQKAASNVEFGISAGAYAGSTGTINYKINNQANESVVDPEFCDSLGAPGGDGISADYPQVRYEFALGANFADGAIPQSCIMGQVSVSLTNFKPALYGKVTVYAAVEGYHTEGSVGKTVFGAPILNDVEIVDGDTVCAGAKDISAGANGSESLVVWVKFDNFDNLELDELNELYQLNVSWGEVSSEYNKAYIVGDETHWTKDEKYAMYVQPESTTYTWIYDSLPGTFGNIKVQCGNVWCHDGENHALEADKTYTVDWTAGSDLHLTVE